MTLSQVAEALASVDVAERQRIIRARNGYTIIDDSYNASPASVLAALDLLAEIPGRRLALLGDMLELGAYEEEGHRKVGRRAAAVLDSLYLIGPRTAWIAEEALKGGLESVCTLPSKEAAVETISKELRAGDVLLVKGSRGLALETVVNALC
jgi:UDP-N-acetylmuramoyl-tripeptide--D-alanyl-D-alanine ligase